MGFDPRVWPCFLLALEKLCKTITVVLELGVTQNPLTRSQIESLCCLHVSCSTSPTPKLGNRPKVYALISTLAATEASNGIDMFSGAATKLIYICPVSSSCSPHVTSCHVGALIAESPWPCRLLLLSLAFLPLTRSVVSLLPPLSMTPHLHVSSVFPRSTTTMWFCCMVERNQPLFTLSNAIPVRCCELFNSRWCPSVASPLHPVSG